MLRYKNWQLAIVMAVIALGALFASPNLVPERLRESMPAFLPNGAINLGLDLQGGSYLLLGVDTEKVIADRLTALRQDIQREMRPQAGRQRITLGALPTTNVETGVVSFRVRDPSDAEEAAKRVRNLTRAGVIPGAPQPYEVKVVGPRIDVTIRPEARRFYASEAVGDSIEVVRRRIDPAGNKEVSIQPQGGDRIVIQVPGDNDPEALKALINRTGQLSFHRHDPGVSVEEAQGGYPGRIVVPFTESEGPGALVLHEDPEVTGDMVQNANADLNPDGVGFQINFSFDNRGSIRFADYTQEHVGEIFAIVLDNEIISAPRIQTPITGGSGRITGNFTPEEAARISLLIRSGALPAKLTTLEQRTVGPDLGKDSIRKGTIALVIGFFAVVAFMIVTYGLFGVFANIALFFNVVLLVGFLSMTGATLTLPGMAGIVLTIGTAVDANVLIFERIREEVAAGKAPIVAAGLGFDKAFSAIADSNVTHFLAALIMLFLGAGPVRGFAVTFAIGVFTSVFTSIVITRILVGAYLLQRRPKAITL